MSVRHGNALRKQGVSRLICYIMRWSKRRSKQDMTCKVKGILLRISPTVRDERMLTILTDRLGCISVFQKSGRKVQYDQFYYGEWVLYQTGGGNYLLNGFCPEELFHPLREQIENTFLASYFAQMVLYFGRDADNDCSELLPLLLNGLFLLGKGKEPLLVKSVFELKTMQLMGYCPTLSTCGHEPTYFSLEDGSICCGSCASPNKSVKISATILAAVAHILNKSPQKAYGFTIPKEELLGLSLLAERFSEYHLELRASALQMWKDIYHE